MAHTPNLLPYKIFVISLGLLLVGGTVMLGATIINKANHAEIAPQCPDATVRLEGKGMPMAVSTPDNHTIVVTVVKGQESKVLTVERCTGKILQTLTVVP